MKALSFLLFLYSMSSLASTINIGVSQTNAGPVTNTDIVNILKCTANSKDHSFTFKKYPNLRGLKYVKKGALDAYYPIHVTEHNQTSSLLPIYIDEILLISKIKVNIDQPLTVGIIRNEQEPIVEMKPHFQIKYTVNSSEALLKGIKNNRVSNILLYRSQLPKDIDLSPYFVQTILYKDVGIQINQKFEEKVRFNKEKLQKRFIRCILNYDFKLSNIRKRAIHMAITSDIKSLQDKFSISESNIKNISSLEKKWLKKDNKLFQKVLRNDSSNQLKEISKDLTYLSEAFIFNNQGGLVAAINPPSDFYQGDEEKFNVVKEHKNFTIRNISNIYFDESTNSFQVGITIRLEDKNGNFSGGLYLGADINKLISFYRLN